MHFPCRNHRFRHPPDRVRSKCCATITHTKIWYGRLDGWPIFEVRPNSYISARPVPQAADTETIVANGQGTGVRL